MYRKVVQFVFCALALLSPLFVSGVAAHTLSGTVYGGSKPLPGATVTLADAVSLEKLGTTTTAAGGFYGFSLNDGSYNLAIAPPAGSGFSLSVVKSVAVSGGNVTQNVVLISLAHTLAGVVRLSDGTPVGGVVVALKEQTSDALVSEVTTGADGRYSFPVSPATYKIDVSGSAFPGNALPNVTFSGAPSFFTIQPLVANLVVAGDTTRDITLPFVLLSGKTKTQNGEPIPGVRLQQAEHWFDYTTTPNGYTYYQHDIGSVVSDDTGSYRMMLIPHAHDITLVPPVGSGLATTVVNNVLPTTATTRDFILGPPSTLAGVVRLSDGIPVSGVEVALKEQTSDAQVGVMTTGADGRYSFPVSPATYKINVSGSAFPGNVEPKLTFPGAPSFFTIQPLVANLVVAGDTTRDITLPFVLLSGKTKKQNGEPIPGVRLQQAEHWFDYTVSPNVYTYYQHDIGSVVSDDTGSYRMMLIPHAHDITLVPPVGSGLATTVVNNVVLTAATTRDFILGPPSILAGVVRLPDGTPVGGVVITLKEQASDAVVSEVVSGADGRYSFPVSPATYKIDVSGAALPSATYRLTLPGAPSFFVIQPLVANLVVAGDTTRDITLPFVSLSGRTTDRNGVAVPGVRLQQAEHWFDYSVTPNVYTYYQHDVGSVVSDNLGSYRMLLIPHSHDIMVLPPNGSGFAQTPIIGLIISHSLLQNIILDLADVTAPTIISGPTVSAIADTSALVSWQTSEPANGGVSYATASPPYGAVAEAAGYRTLHTRVINGLVPDTTYYVSVSASDESGNGPIASGIVSFHTRLTPDVTPPVIVDGPIVSGITHEEAVVEWSTDEPSTGAVTYGLAGEAGESFVDETFATTHRVLLGSLTADALYHVQVAATDDFGNGPTLSPVIAFHTMAAPDTTPPVIVEGPLAIDISATTATIIWTTDEPATSGVSWNDGTAYDLVSDPALTTAHLVTLTNLRPDTRYSYTVSTTDGAGNGPTLSEEATFTTGTSGDTHPPVFTKGPWVHVVNHQKAQIKWETDEPSDSVVEYGLSAAALLESESKVGLVIHHTVDLNHLAEDTVYFFRVRSTDESGNSAVSAVQSFRTTDHDADDESAPVVTLGPVMVYASDTVATVRWETDVPTDTVVEYAAPGQPVQRLSDAEKKLVHQVTLTNLAAGESYTVAVFGTDARGRQVALPAPGRGATAAAVAGSVPTTDFTAPADPDATAPAITGPPLVIWRSDRAALIRWRTDEIADSVVRFGPSGQPLAAVAGAINDVLVHEVMLTNLAPGAAYDYRVSSTDPVGNGPRVSAVAHFATLAVPASISIRADKPSPQHLGTAGMVTFTARISGTSETFEYQFWLKPKKSGTYALKQGYGSAASWAWSPDPLDPVAVDTYEVRVRARRAGSTAPYELSAAMGYALVAQPPVATVTLSADKHWPRQAGTQVNVTAEAGVGAYEYKFWVARNGGPFVVVPPGYVADKTLAWMPTQAGAYRLAVWVRNAASVAPFEQKAEIVYYVTAAAPVAAVSLVASPKSPQLAGTAVTFTAKATPGTPGDALEYRFWLYAPASGKWTAVGDATTGYSAARIWHWTPDAAGDYQVMVYARTAGESAPYEMLKKLAFRVD